MGKWTFLFNGKTWMLVLDSIEKLNAYMEMVWDIRWKDLEYDVARLRKKQHPTSDIIGVCEVLANAKGTNVLKEFWDLREAQHKEMTHLILEGKTLYVNPAGGYTPQMENIMNRCESDELRWPVFSEDDIRIRQWPGGTHYYAYIGPVQVKDSDTFKWESESDARTAAMAYVTKKSQSRVR